MSVLSMFPFGGGAGGNEGMYCWAKYNDNPAAAVSVSVAANTTTLTDVGNGEYSIKTASLGAGWGKHYIRSEFIDTATTPLKIQYTSHPTAYLSNIFIGFVDTETTQLTSVRDGIYLVYDKNVQHYKNGASAGNISTHKNGDAFELVVDNGVVTVHQNGNLLYSQTLTTKSVAAFITMYDAGTTFGTFSFEKVVDSPIVGYVLSDDINAYPDYGFADDGFFYESINSKIGDMQNALSILGVEV